MENKYNIVSEKLKISVSACHVTAIGLSHEMSTAAIYITDVVRTGTAQRQPCQAHGPA